MSVLQASDVLICYIIIIIIIIIITKSNVSRHQTNN